MIILELSLDQYKMLIEALGIADCWDKCSGRFKSLSDFIKKHARDSC